MKKIKSEMLKKFMLFCIVGFLTVIVDLSVFNILFWLKVHFSLSRAGAALSAITFNFILNRNMTFKAKSKPIIEQYPKHFVVYMAVLITNVIISSAVFWFLGEGTFNANLASMVGIVSTIPISFSGSMFWTFKK